MSQTEYSFLDFTVMPFLRKRVISDEAAILFSMDMSRVLWANAIGTRLFGGAHVIDLLESKLSPNKPLIRQLNHAAEQIGDEGSIVRSFSVTHGLKSDTVRGALTRITLPDGQTALLLTCEPQASSHRYREHELAEMSVECLDGFADASAIIDEYGLILASSQQFDAFEIDPVTLETLVKMVAREEDRLVKRPIESGSGDIIAAGLGRIRDFPSRFIVVLAEAEAAEPVEDTPQTGDIADLVQTFSDEAVTPSDLPPWHEIPEQADFDDFQPPRVDVEGIVEVGGEVPGDPLEHSPDDSLQTSDEETVTDDGEKQSEEATPPSLLDRWYFEAGSKDDKAVSDEPSEDIPTSIVSEDLDSDQVKDHPARFAFTINSDGAIRSVSPELAQAVGPVSGDIVGKNWQLVASERGFDQDGAIADLLARADTWSGKTVLWPVDATDMAIPVDLAALPAFDRERRFEGFRGFGIIRSADVIVDPEGRGLSLVSGEASASQSRDDEALPDDDGTDIPFSGWQPGLDTPQTLDDDSVPEAGSEEIGAGGENVYHLPIPPAHEQTPAQEGELNGREKRAFDEISQNLSESLKEARKSEAEHEDSNTGVVLPGGSKGVLADLSFPVLVYQSGGTLFANDALLDQTGYDSLEDLASSGGIEALLTTTDEAESTDGPGGMVIRRKDGSPIDVNSRLTKVDWRGTKALCLSFDERREPTGLTGNISDQEKAVLDMLRVSELESILETAADGLLIIDNDGKIESLNSSGEALFGREQADVIGMPFTSLFATESKTILETHLEELKGPGVAGVMNQGREVIGIEARGRLIPLFALIGAVGNSGRFCAVLRDLTAWKKAEEELVEAKRKAETASDQKSEFLSRVSHEIREPLTSIIGFSDVMIEERFGRIDNPRYREYLKDINRSGIHVLDLVNDLLDISKIEAGKLDLSYEAVDLNRLASETVALMQPKANNKRIIIRTSLSRAVPKVVADARSIRQIILNLVSNAIRHSDRNSQVIVSTTYEENGEVALRVRDTGAGMSEAELQQALEPFTQVGDDRGDIAGGTGLGLPLTKALVEANRAYFELESKKGEGTIAHIQFPSQRVLAD